MITTTITQIHNLQRAINNHDRAERNKTLAATLGLTSKASFSPPRNGDAFISSGGPGSVSRSKSGSISSSAEFTSFSAYRNEGTAENSAHTQAADDEDDANHDAFDVDLPERKRSLSDAVSRYVAPPSSCASSSATTVITELRAISTSVRASKARSQSFQTQTVNLTTTTTTTLRTVGRKKQQTKRDSRVPLTVMSALCSGWRKWTPPSTLR